MLSLQRRILVAGLLLLVVIAFGVAGYMVLERWNFQDSLFMTIISLTTVGYGETNPLTPKGRVFTMVLLLMGIGVLGYSFGTMTAFIVEGQLSDILRKRKMEKSISELRDHIIICGLGDTGRHVIEELLKTKNAFVVVELDGARLADLAHRLEGLLYIEGDATKDNVLRRANVEHARGLVSALPGDAENLFVVLTARELNPRMRIVTRVFDRGSEHKLLKVGANAVVSANFIGGLRMASEVVRPAVVSFLDVMLREKDRTLRLDEVTLPEGSSFVGRTLREAAFPEKVGLLAVAVKERGTGRFLYNPRADYALRAGDTVIVIGDVSQILKLKTLLGYVLDEVPKEVAPPGGPGGA